MKDIIIQKLKEIEKQENIKIIYAVESGSRAWGFESPDSDYDVRFIYVRNRNDYLSLFKMKDTIEWELNDTFDISGWDLKKTLQLLYQSNPTLYEWKNSPVVYLTTPQWEYTYQTFEYYFQIQVALHHYYHMTLTTYQRPKTLKRYLYTLRSLLSCLWIIENHTAPPIEFNKLVDAHLSDHLKPVIKSMLIQKKQHSENQECQDMQIINEYINKQLTLIQSYLKTSREHLDKELLEKTFLNIIHAIS